MSTSLKELRRRVVLNIGRVDGQSMMVIDDAINQAHMNIARVKDFDELMVLDTTNASTVPGQKLYHIVNDWGLVRPKDIYTIRYMDGSLSRKLEYVPAMELDSRLPYTETVGTGRPKYYTRRGMYVELFRIPDAAAQLYVFHSQWPNTLSDDDDETPYLQLDDVIVTLATEIASSMLNQGGPGNWYKRARELLGIVLNEERTRPDRFLVASPFEPVPKTPVGNYWLDPWVRRS